MDDPSVWAIIVKLALDQTIKEYASLRLVCQLLSLLVNDYMRQEIEKALLSEIPASAVINIEYTPVFYRNFSIRLQAPTYKNQTRFKFAYWGMDFFFPTAVSVNNICKTVLLRLELREYKNSLKAIIDQRIAEYWETCKIDECQFERSTIISRYQKSQAKAKQQAHESFRHWKRKSKREYRLSTPKGDDFDLFKYSEFGLSGSLFS